MEPHTSLPNLLCEENESSLKENKDGFVSESECEFIEMLFQCELSFQIHCDVNSVWTERCWFGSVRSDVIKWILEVCFPFLFNFFFPFQIQINTNFLNVCAEKGSIWIPLPHCLPLTHLLRPFSHKEVDFCEYAHHFESCFTLNVLFIYCFGLIMMMLGWKAVENSNSIDRVLLVGRKNGGMPSKAIKGLCRRGLPVFDEFHNENGIDSPKYIRMENVVCHAF